MAYLIIDEWLWEDLSRAKGTEKGKEAFNFLRAIFQKCDNIVIVRPSKFLQKAWNLFSRPDLEAKYVASYFAEYFLQNSKKVRFVETSELPPLPKQFEASVKDDDHYLVQAYVFVDAELLITTDSPLKDALIAGGLNCEWRDWFLPQYIEKYLHTIEPNTPKA
jgi:hypothetical protein